MDFLASVFFRKPKTRKTRTSPNVERHYSPPSSTKTKKKVRFNQKVLIRQISDEIVKDLNLIHSQSKSELAENKALRRLRRSFEKKSFPQLDNFLKKPRIIFETPSVAEEDVIVLKRTSGKGRFGSGGKKRKGTMRR